MATVTIPAPILKSVIMGKRGFGHVYLRGRIWWVKCHRDGIPHYQSSKSENKEDANRLLKELLNQEKPTAEKVMVRDLITDALAFYEEERPKSHKDFAIPVSKALLAFFRYHKASQVTTEQLRQYRAKRKAAGKAVATINREMAFLRLSFRRAMKTTPPKIRTLPYFPMVKENNARKGFVTPEQYRDLLSKMEPATSALLVIGYHTGCRASELLTLKWAQVDLDGKILRLEDTKNGEAREIPVYGEMGPTLQVLRSATPKRCPWVFHRGGERIRDFRHGWERAREAAGLPELLFHDLRRSAVRNMVLAGIPEKVAMSISGHKTRAVFDRYMIVDRKDKEDAGKKLSEYLNNGKEARRG